MKSSNQKFYYFGQIRLIFQFLVAFGFKNYSLPYTTVFSNKIRIHWYQDYDHGTKIGRDIKKIRIIQTRNFIILVKFDSYFNFLVTFGYVNYSLPYTIVFSIKTRMQWYQDCENVIKIGGYI